MFNRLYLNLKNIAFVTVFYLLNPSALLKRIKTYKNARYLDTTNSNQAKVSIVILTFNAFDYVKKCLDSLTTFKPSNSEIIVVDNGSGPELIEYLQRKKEEKVIDKLYLSPVNTYYAKGNNIGANMSDSASQYILLLNSDVEIKTKDWCDVLRSNAPEKGIISFGKTDIPVTRPDGWCFMIDRKNYLELGGINEYYKLNWGITELTGKVGKLGYPIKSVINPDKCIVHYGQKSYVRNTLQEKFNRMSNQEVLNLFKETTVNLLKV